MTTRAILAATILTAAAILWTPPVVAQTDSSLTTGAGAGVYPSGTSFNGIPISGLQFGMGVELPAGGTVAGQFQVLLLGLSVLGQEQLITIEGEANSGSVKADGTSGFSGVCTVDMGDGTLPLVDVPFTVTATATSLVLVIGTTNLPSASVSEGGITIR